MPLAKESLQIAVVQYRVEEVVLALSQRKYKQPTFFAEAARVTRWAGAAAGVAGDARSERLETTFAASGVCAFTAVGNAAIRFSPGAPTGFVSSTPHYMETRSSTSTSHIAADVEIHEHLC